MRVERGRWTPADRDEALYRYVPFEVPAGVAAISGRLRYDRRGSVIDLGLFDPGGFRGWSGSSKEGFVVTADRATPGYLPGPLTAGEWQVLLGLHRVPPAGVAFELEIDLGPADPEPAAPAPPRPARPPRRELPATEGRAWLAGDLHTHTVHSDGVVTVAALACLARERGLDFLAVTDHNTTSHHAELPAAADLAGVLLVAGLELTTERGHANCLGSSRWVDFRRSADDWLVDAEAAGGLLSINHPLAGEMAWTLPMERLPPLVEVWHSSWDRLGLGPLEWWKEWGGGLPVGGSDFHRFGDDDLPGAPTTWLEVEGEDVLGALRAGRVVLSAGPRAPVAVRHEDTLLLLDADGTTLVGPEDVSRRIASDRERLPAGTGPYRLVGDDGLTLALTP
jgi:predicted metal-dependent phosphoesterase TrpH